MWGGGEGVNLIHKLKLVMAKKKKIAKKQYVRVVSDQNTLIYRMLA